MIQGSCIGKGDIDFIEIYKGKNACISDVTHIWASIEQPGRRMYENI